MNSQDPRRNVRAVCLSQFFLTLSFNFANVLLPFYIRQISTLDAEHTVAWTGWIMGAPSAALIVFGPLWSNLAGRVSPKLLYQRGLAADVVALALMPFMHDLRLLLAVQVASGIFGGVSMIGLILIAASSTPERLPHDVGQLQAASTAGQVVGPLVGSYAASLLGFRWSFLIAAAGVALTMIYAQMLLVDRRMTPRPREAAGRLVLPWVAAAVALLVAATMQLVFLPPLLPYLLPAMGVSGPSAVRAAGLLVLAYATTAAVGAYLISRLASPFGFLRSLCVCVLLCSGLLWCLSWVTDLLIFGVLRALQTGVVAGVFPIVVGRAASTAGPGTLGVLSASRFAGNASGVLLATSIYGYWGAEVVFRTFASLTLAAAAAFVAVHLSVARRAARQRAVWVSPASAPAEHAS